MAQSMQESLPSLPSSLIDSYRQYKSDTNSFTNWLVNVGTKSGFRLPSSTPETPQIPPPPPQKSGPRLKGKDRKLAKEAAKNDPASVSSDSDRMTKVLPLRDFPELARHIASITNPPIQVPQSIIKKLERAIALRHQCASWFKTEAEGRPSLASNDSHQHFIEVLEIVLQILQPLFNRASGAGQRRDTTRNDGKCAEDPDPDAKLRNRFAALTTETGEEDGELEVLLQPRTSGKARKPTLFERASFVPEPQSQKDEFLLGCFCFFQDVQDVRQFLQEIWHKYKETQVTLVTASLVTTAALDFVRRAEVNFKATLSQTGDYYDCFVDQMFRQACEVRGQAFVAKRELNARSLNTYETLAYSDDMAGEAEWIMLPTWDMLRQCARFYFENEDGSRAIYKLNPVPEGKMAEFWQKQALDAGLTHTELTRQLWFNRLLLGLGMMSFTNQPEDIGVDGFREGLNDMTFTKKVPAWLVFAAQNFLDIHHILKGDISRGLHELESTCAGIRYKIQQHIDALGQLAQPSILDEQDGRWLKTYREKFFGDDCKDFGAVFAMHPLGAGLRLFFAVSWFRRSGADCRNSADIVAMAQLYQAAQLQSNCVKWPDMEFILTSQTPEYIFFGGRPTTYKQSCLKTELAAGYSIRNKNLILTMPEDPILSRNGHRLLTLDDTPFTTAFWARGWNRIQALLKEQQRT